MDYLKEIEKEIKGKTFIEQMQVIKKYVIFNSPNNVGVYQIENFYVGKSGNILARITHHIIEVIKAEESKIIFNKKKLYLIGSILKSKKLQVKHLDKKQSKEKFYIEELYPNLPLTNIEFVTEKMVRDKQIKISKILKYKSINYILDRFTSKYYVSKVIFNDILILEIESTYEAAKKKLKSYVATKAPHKKSRAERKK